MQSKENIHPTFDTIKKIAKALDVSIDNSNVIKII